MYMLYNAPTHFIEYISIASLKKKIIIQILITTEQLEILVNPNTPVKGNINKIKSTHGN